MAKGLALGLQETLNGRMERVSLWGTNTRLGAVHSVSLENTLLDVWLGLLGWLSTGTGLGVKGRGRGCEQLVGAAV